LALTLAFNLANIKNRIFSLIAIAYAGLADYLADYLANLDNHTQLL
jgi:hypothetical protein